MSDTSQNLAGILLFAIPTVIYGGVFILQALVDMLYIHQTDLSAGVKTLTRTLLIAPPILMPLGFGLL
ncbi:MAG: hypothetical protein H0T78_07765 [Longispora sp.]|nr:hypothetical protein [Longispora sp. (in: high G+C Gram-positive bacteria)]